MSLFDLLIGKPIATTEERAEHIGPVAGIPVFGLDALSSAAYGPEAALTLLIPLGLAGIQHIVPISFAIVGLLAIVYAPVRFLFDFLRMVVVRYGGLTPGQWGALVVMGLGAFILMRAHKKGEAEASPASDQRG